MYFYCSEKVNRNGTKNVGGLHSPSPTSEECSLRCLILPAFRSYHYIVRHSSNKPKLGKNSVQCDRKTARQPRGLRYLR